MSLFFITSIDQNGAYFNTNDPIELSKPLRFLYILFEIILSNNNLVEYDRVLDVAILRTRSLEKNSFELNRPVVPTCMYGYIK